MDETTQLGLPLVLPAQAQKHVTVNEALARLDALAQLRVVSSDLPTPPGDAGEGAAWIVGPGAAGAWAGAAGQIAIRVNGGWEFVVPKAGWRAWDETLGAVRQYDGTGWVEDVITATPGGAGTRQRVIEIDHVLAGAAESQTESLIPSHAQVTGVTARVITSITGPGLTGWSLGVPGAADRHGSGLGLAAQSFALGITGQPVTYYTPTPLLLTAEGGTFAGGAVRLAVHLTELLPPRAI